MDDQQEKLDRAEDECRRAAEAIERRLTSGTCAVHNEPLVLVWRREKPTNMNGAPRPVCPDCLEERVEKLEAGIRAEVAAIPGHVIVREGGGDEDVLASLAVSVGRLKTGAAAPDKTWSATSAMRAALESAKIACDRCRYDQVREAILRGLAVGDG